MNQVMKSAWKPQSLLSPKVASKVHDGLQHPSRVKKKEKEAKNRDHDVFIFSTSLKNWIESSLITFKQKFSL